MRRLIVAIAFLLLAAAPAHAAPEGTVVLATPHGFDTLVARLRQAVADNKMGLVSQASASAGAARRGVTIPGNYVAGVYRNDFAVRMLKASVPAGIEAPIRFYVTAEDDGTASLRYRPPSVVFAPYDDGGTALDDLAQELDVIFATIAKQAVAR